MNATKLMALCRGLYCQPSSLNPNYPERSNQERTATQNAERDKRLYSRADAPIQVNNSTEESGSKVVWYALQMCSSFAQQGVLWFQSLLPQKAQGNSSPVPQQAQGNSSPVHDCAYMIKRAKVIARNKQKLGELELGKDYSSV